MGALATLMQATAVQAYTAGTRSHARAPEAPVEDFTRWRPYEEERARAWRVWQATRPDAGYVAHRLGQQYAADDPGQRLRGQATYAQQASQRASVEGPGASVSLLV